MILYAAEGLLASVMSGELYRIVILAAQMSDIRELPRRFLFFLLEVAALEILAGSARM